MKPNRPVFIGITGGIGAGKTEILNYIGKHYKCEIYLADEVAHRVEEPGTECYERLMALLGTDVTGADGRIERRRWRRGSLQTQSCWKGSMRSFIRR